MLVVTFASNSTLTHAGAGGDQTTGEDKTRSIEAIANGQIADKEAVET